MRRVKRISNLPGHIYPGTLSLCALLAGDRGLGDRRADDDERGVQREQDAPAEDGPARPEVAHAGGRPDDDQRELDDAEDGGVRGEEATAVEEIGRASCRERGEMSVGGGV